MDPAAGETYASEDPEACARAVLSMLARDPADLRAAAARVARAIVRVEGHFAKLLDIYRELLAERRALRAPS